MLVLQLAVAGIIAVAACDVCLLPPHGLAPGEAALRTCPPAIPHAGAGVEVRSLTLGAEQQAALFPRLPVHVQRAAVAEVDLQLPTWRRPLLLRVRGVRLDLLQRNMPVVGAPFVSATPPHGPSPFIRAAHSYADLQAQGSACWPASHFCGMRS